MGISIEFNRLKSMLEQIWDNLDRLFAGLDAQDWQRWHGPDWVFANVPYHLAYFDRHIARYLEQGPDLPQDEQLRLTSLADMARWNAANFESRPTGQTPAESLAKMRSVRDRIRRALEGKVDSDLNGTTWMMLLGLRGWRNIGIFLQTLIMHTWNEFIQLRIHMGLDSPEPDPALTRFCIQGFLAYSQAFMDTQAASKANLTVVYDFPDLAAWTLKVHAGDWQIEEGEEVKADIVFTHAYVTYMKVFNRILDFSEALEKGEIRVEGAGRLAEFAALYPSLEPDQIVPAASS